MEKKVDRRIIKTQGAIQQAFKELVTKGDFDTLTVTVIAEKANISRKTFYLHYLDKYDLLDKIIDQYLAELEYVCEKRKEVGIVEATKVWFTFFDAHQAFFQKLLKSTGTYSFRNKFLDFAIAQIKKKETDENPIDAVDVRFLGYGVIGIIESYLLNMVTEDQQLLSKRVSSLVYQNL